MPKTLAALFATVCLVAGLCGCDLEKSATVAASINAYRVGAHENPLPVDLPLSGYAARWAAHLVATGDPDLVTQPRSPIVDTAGAYQAEPHSATYELVAHSLTVESALATLRITANLDFWSEQAWSAVGVAVEPSKTDSTVYVVIEFIQFCFTCTA